MDSWCQEYDEIELRKSWAIPFTPGPNNNVNPLWDLNDMDETSPATELILNASQRSLGSLQLDWTPQPGHYLHHEGQEYLVLERRHRYQFHTHHYHLSKIDLYVQRVSRSIDKRWVGDRWVIGDTTCQFNAQSELVRCAVNPAGPCDGCPHYQADP